MNEAKEKQRAASARKTWMGWARIFNRHQKQFDTDAARFRWASSALRRVLEEAASNMQTASFMCVHLSRVQTEYKAVRAPRRRPPAKAKSKKPLTWSGI